LLKEVGEKLIPLIGLLIGIILGLFLKVDIPAAYSTYVPVAILAALDSVFGGFRAYLEGKFESDIFISGFFGNVIIASLLAYLGDRLNVPIYLAAVFVFGSRLFNNFAIIRRLILSMARSKNVRRKNDEV